MQRHASKAAYCSVSHITNYLHAEACMQGSVLQCVSCHKLSACTIVHARQRTAAQPMRSLQCADVSMQGSVLPPGHQLSPSATPGGVPSNGYGGVIAPQPYRQSHNEVGRWSYTCVYVCVCVFVHVCVCV